MSEQGQQSAPFASVAVLGPGLLGGSIAKAVRERMPSCELRLWARRQEPLELARRLSIADRTYRDVAEAVRGAQLVILATPIGVFPQLVSAMLPALDAEALVTDVGSVKAAVHAGVGTQLTQAGRSFIGSHPMAGAEKQGLEHARADLLEGATVALTNPHGVAEEMLARLAAFWQALGSRTCEMSPELHDLTTARISHVPHALAALCARSAGAAGIPPELLRRLASSGFRDTTRVSSGGAAMWADILSSNADAVRAALRDCIADLRHLDHLLEQDDKASLHTWLEQAKESRENILRR